MKKIVLTTEDIVGIVAEHLYSKSNKKEVIEMIGIKDCGMTAIVVSRKEAKIIEAYEKLSLSGLTGDID